MTKGRIFEEKKSNLQIVDPKRLFKVSRYISVTGRYPSAFFFTND